MDRSAVKISVCVVTYNQEKYIAECLQSIVDQETSFSFEVIVSDDGSKDKTREIILEYAEKYPHLIFPVLRAKNVGPFENYVDTHNLANGEYVAHIDGDDRMLPGKLEAQCQYLESDPFCTVVWHRMNVFNDSGGFYNGENYKIGDFEKRNVTVEDALTIGAIGWHSSIMYRKKARTTRMLCFPMLDTFYAIEFLFSGHGKYLMDVLGEYRVGSSSSISVKMESYIHQLYVQHWQYYLNLHPEKRKYIFIFATLNFLIDVKNMRRSALSYLGLVLRSISIVTPQEVVWAYRTMRTFIIPKLPNVC